MTTNKTFLFTGLTIFAAGLTQAQNKAPNILFIMSDDHTSQAISAYGGFLGQYMPTPNIDRLAKEGARMNNCFVTNSISTPSRGCILTGQYSQKNGVYTLSDMIDRDHPNVAKDLQKEGYQTAIIGKWHLGTEPAGFDYYNVLPGQGRYYNPQLIKKGDWNSGPNGRIKMTEHGGHSTDVIANDAISFLQSTDRDKPFFLMCHFKAPHSLWQPADRFNDLLKDIDIPEPSNLLDTYEGKGKYTQHLWLTLSSTTNMKPDFKLIYLTTGKNISRSVIPHFFIISMQYSSFPISVPALLVPNAKRIPASLAVLMIFSLGKRYRALISSAICRVTKASITLLMRTSVHSLS